MSGAISILIPAFQAGKFLPSALASIEAQTCREWELIVVEDGSRDETENVVRSFSTMHPDHRVVYENLVSNRGVAAARNRLLELAGNPFIAFLDADDVWEPDHIERLIQALEKDADLVVSGICIWDASKNQAVGDYLPSPQQLQAPVLSLFQRSFIQTSSSVGLRRTLVDCAGRFDEELQIGEDRDYWFRCLLQGGGLGCTHKITSRYTKHESSAMTRTLRVAEDAVRFHRKHLDERSIPAAIRKSQLAESLENLGRLQRRDKPLESRRLLLEALRLQPWRWRTLLCLSKSWLAGM
jgi:glycosyltransferase involved in cell wall biosynthesis